MVELSARCNFYISSTATIIAGSRFSTICLTSGIIVICIGGKRVVDLGAILASNIRSTTAIIAKCLFSAISGAGFIVLIYVVSKFMRKSRTCVNFGIFCSTTFITQSGLGAVHTTCCIFVTYIIAIDVRTNNINTTVYNVKINWIHIKVINLTIIVRNSYIC